MQNADATIPRSTAGRIPFLGFLLAALTLLPAWCGTTGSISGVLKDRAGAPIEGARMTLINTAMGFKNSTSTGKKGSYSFPIVPEGQYELHVEAKGYKAQNRAGLVVHVNSAIRVDLTLAPDEAATDRPAGAEGTPPGR